MRDRRGRLRPSGRRPASPAPGAPAWWRRRGPRDLQQHRRRLRRRDRRRHPACGNDAGECVAGTETCWTGVWGVCVGGVGPSTEICNGLDDDRDGATDEGDPGGGASCGGSIGECCPAPCAASAADRSATAGRSRYPSCATCGQRLRRLDRRGQPRRQRRLLHRRPGHARDRRLRGRRHVVVCGAFVCSGETLPRAEDCNGLMTTATAPPTRA